MATGYNCRTISKAVLAAIPDLAEFHLRRHDSGYFYIDGQFKNGQFLTGEAGGIYTYRVGNFTVEQWVEEIKVKVAAERRS